MRDAIPYNESFIHKSKHMARSEKVHTPQQYTVNVPGRRTTAYSQNEMYGSQYVGDKFIKTYLPNIPQRAKNREMDRRRKKTQVESNAYGEFYKPRQEYTGRVQYDIDRDYLPASNPRYDQIYQVHTNTAPSNPLNQAVNTVHLPRTEPLPPITPQPQTTSYDPPASPGDSWDHLQLPNLKDVELEVTCGDFSTVNLSRGPNGYNYYSNRGKHSLKLPEIREMKVYFKTTDGKTMCFEGLPKYNVYE